MTVNLRSRISVNPDIQKAKEIVSKPKLYKCSVFIEHEMYKRLKKRAVDEGCTVTNIINQTIKDYLDG